MPELPEVETIARALREGGHTGPPIVGRTIRAADLLWARTLADPLPDEFIRRLPGQRIESVGRRAKYLCMALNQDTLLLHLRMSGDVRVEAQELARQPHDRLILEFENGLRLAFNDARKFGRVWLTADPQTVLGGLGPEPLDEGFTAEELYARLQNHHRRLKPLLLDQTFLAGLGNIYTDEALHTARLHPLRMADSLTLDEAGALWGAIRAVLNEGIRRNGASIDWVYRGGEFQNTFRVYQRTGQACPQCGTPVERLVVGQRGTHICPRCQALPEK